MKNALFWRGTKTRPRVPPGYFAYILHVYFQLITVFFRQFCPNAPVPNPWGYIPLQGLPGPRGEQGLSGPQGPRVSK